MDSDTWAHIMTRVLFSCECRCRQVERSAYHAVVIRSEFHINTRIVQTMEQANSIALSISKHVFPFTPSIILHNIPLADSLYVSVSPKTRYDRIESLDISIASLTDRAAARIVSCCDVVDLTFHDVPLLGKQTISVVASRIINSRKLNKLWIHDCALDDTALELIAHACLRATECSKLEWLDISHNSRHTQFGLACILYAYHQNKSLLDILVVGGKNVARLPLKLKRMFILERSEQMCASLSRLLLDFKPPVWPTLSGMKIHINKPCAEDEVVHPHMQVAEDEAVHPHLQATDVVQQQATSENGRGHAASYYPKHMQHLSRNERRRLKIPFAKRCEACDFVWPEGSVTISQCETYRSLCKLHNKKCSLRFSNYGC